VLKDFDEHQEQQTHQQQGFGPSVKISNKLLPLLKQRPPQTPRTSGRVIIHPCT
jgi:hypothetical protein